MAQQFRQHLLLEFNRLYHAARRLEDDVQTHTNQLDSSPPRTDRQQNQPPRSSEGMNTTTTSPSNFAHHDIVSTIQPSSTQVPPRYSVRGTEQSLEENRWGWRQRQGQGSSGQNVPTVGPTQLRSQRQIPWIEIREGQNLQPWNSAQEPCPSFSDEDAYQMLGSNTPQSQRQNQISFFNRGAQHNTSQDGVLNDLSVAMEVVEEPTNINNRAVVNAQADASYMARGSQLPDEFRDVLFGRQVEPHEAFENVTSVLQGQTNIQNEEETEVSDEVFEKVPSCSFLCVGIVLAGWQMVRNDGLDTDKPNKWGVTVTIQGLDMDRGYLCGMMRSVNVPGASGPILTFWEGEIIDNINYTFQTQKWDARARDDECYWNLFSSFAQIQNSVSHGRCKELSTHSHIYMRWKEQFFVHDCPNSRLTISGFYYVTLNRLTGETQGWYFDKSMGRSDQELLLDAMHGYSGSCRSQGEAGTNSSDELGQNVCAQKKSLKKQYRNILGQGFPSYSLY